MKFPLPFPAVLAALAVMLFARCAPAPEASAKEDLSLLFEDDFSGPLEAWAMTDPDAWRLAADGGRAVLELFSQSRYEPPVRSPRNIAWIEGIEVSDFVLEVLVRSTHEEYDHRDICVFWGGQSPSRFYYAHLASRADENANSIFLVDDAPRVSIAGRRSRGTEWDDDYHLLRVERDTAAGTINVYFDDRTVPTMTARDRTFIRGRVGIGSFDDTGRFDRVRLWGIRSSEF